MYEFLEKKRFKKLLYSYVALGLLIVLLVLVGKGTWNIYTKHKEADLGEREVEKRLASLKERQGFLEKEVERLETFTGVEREIRATFSLKKPGEEVAIIVDSTTTNEEEAEDRGVLGRMGVWFKGLFE